MVVLNFSMSSAVVRLSAIKSSRVTSILLMRLGPDCSRWNPLTSGCGKSRLPRAAS